MNCARVFRQQQQNMQSITVIYQVIRVHISASECMMFKIYIPQLYNVTYYQFPNDDNIKHMQNVLHDMYHDADESGKRTIRLMISEIARELRSPTGRRQIINSNISTEILTQCSFELNV